jgi:hypothetical protein
MKRINKPRTLVGLRVTILPRGKKGIYYADFHFRGRHCRRSLKTTIKKVATKKAIDLEHELGSGTFQNKVVTTRQEMPIEISKAKQDFINFHNTEGRRRKTVVKYEGILRCFAEFAAKENVTRLGDVDLLLVDKY